MFTIKINLNMKKINLFILLSIVSLGYRANSQNIYTSAGNGMYGYSGDGGPATAAEMDQPGDTKFDASGDYYFGDTYNAVIRKVDHTTGNVTTYVGRGGFGYSGDGGQATNAQLDIVSGLAVDNVGNLYIADRDNDAVRMVNKSTGIITTIAGNGVPGYTGDGGPATASQIDGPRGVALDGSGNIYFTDAANNAVREIKASNGYIYTIAGVGFAGFTGDGGPATSAELSTPYGIAVNAAGEIFIADQSNNRIRKINTSGIISTVAGNGTAGFAGDGGQATAAGLNGPAMVTVALSGDMFISDTYNNRIRLVTAANGNISTLAGTGSPGYTGDGGLATAAQIYEPLGSDINPVTGYLYYSDWGASAVRYITISEEVLAVNEVHENSSLAVYPNPASQNLYIKNTVTTGHSAIITITDILGNELLSQTVSTRENVFQINVSGLSAGMYFVKVVSENTLLTTKFIKQ
jgi:hypothetical protein